MVEFGQCGYYGDCMLATNEDAACFFFGGGGDNVLQGFTDELDGAVERRDSGVGVAEVEDAGDATACLG